MYPYSNRSQSQAPAPPAGSPYLGRPISASQSPEQSRAMPLGPPVGGAEYGGRQSLGPPPGHDGYMPWHQQHGRQRSHPASNNAPGRPHSPQHEMREYYGGGAPSSRRDHQQHRSDDYGRPPPPWLEDRMYGSGRRTPIDERLPSQPPPSYQGGVGHGGGSGGHPGPHLPSFSSHPSSPTHRPRTPPTLSRPGGGNGLSGRPGGMPWDPAATGPMSAPPSMVPRMRPGRDGMPQPGPPPPPQQHQSPPLPGLANPSSSSAASREGRKAHSRLPSWGPHSSSNPDGPPASPRQSGMYGDGGRDGPQSHGPPPPQYRGASTGIADPYHRTHDYAPRNTNDLPRKRPASESPPNAGAQGPPPQQASPSQRADVMSMSSILGPSSSGRASSTALETNVGAGLGADKRRRLDMPPTTIKGEPISGPLTSPIPLHDAPVLKDGDTLTKNGQSAGPSSGDPAAASLARRKWSGPIAEQAAQQAAAWRAQEQSRWGAGNTRSPKIGSMGTLPSGSDRGTPPFGGFAGRPRGASPAVHEQSTAQHRRQRSDGQSAPTPAVAAAAAAPLPPPPAASSNEVRGIPKGARATPPPAAAAAHSKGVAAGKAYKSPKQAYRRPSPPPPIPSPLPQHSMLQQQQQQPPPQPPPQQQQMYGQPPGPGQGVPPPPPPQIYSQPSYHAYDSQGRPVEIDVDEVRGGAFAGHGNPPPPHMMDPAYRHGMPPGYDEPRMRAPPMPPTMQSPVMAQAVPPMNEGPAMPRPPMEQKPPQQMKASAAAAPQNVSGPQKKASGTNGPSAAPARGAPARDREAKQAAPMPQRRSPTPVQPGPAKGLLPPSEEARQQSTGRPVVPSKDFNEGPRVDNDAVWVALRDIEQQERHLVTEDDEEEASATTDQQTALKSTTTLQFDSRPHGLFLGSFLYDSRKSPLLPGELLRRNVGALLEVRVPGEALGVGPSDANLPVEALARKDGQWSMAKRGPHDGVDAMQAPNKTASQDLQGADAEAEAALFWNAKNLLKRKIWGTDIYTDDSDIVAMLLHAGWINGPMLNDVPSWVPPGRAVLAWRRMTQELAEQGEDGAASHGGLQPSLFAKEVTSDEAQKKQKALIDRTARRAATCDLSVLVRVAPKLIAYKGSQRSGVRSRSWGNTHDGVSLLIEAVTLQPAGYAAGERGLRGNKQRIERLAEVKMLAAVAGEPDVPELITVTGGEDGGDDASRADADVAKQRQQLNAGGLLDILAAAQLLSAKDAAVTSTQDKDVNMRRFWQVEPSVDARVAA